MLNNIHSSWQVILSQEFEKSFWQPLIDFVKNEYSKNICYPKWDDIFRTFNLTSFNEVKVVILGQDPYHTPEAAMGLCFSVPSGSKVQPSLQNIFKELQSDIGVTRTQTDITDWAKQGVLLLNSVLTVRAHEPASHKNQGWEIFTDKIIQILSDKKEHIVFIFWGNYAISKKSLVDTQKHFIITSSHPSPFSTHKGFFGSQPFSKTNEYLKKYNKKEIKW